MHVPDRSQSADRSDALVMFGLTGDLGKTKLFPALAELEMADRLGVPVVAVGRTEFDTSDVRNMFRDAVADGGGDDDDDSSSVVDRIDLTYLVGDATESETFDRIASQLGDVSTPVVYAALPPELVGDLTAAVDASALTSDVRLVIEKPFGRDARSARELFDEITRVVPAEQLFIVDHFLAKAAVENLATFRHANPAIDGLLDDRLVESLTVELRESETLDDRGDFYDSVGVIDDVVQNHLLQTLALVTMERPDGSSAAAHQAARRDALSRVRPVDPVECALGQYEGYVDHDGVPSDSSTATFADLRLHITDARWDRTEVRIVTGKALDRDESSVTFTFRPVGDEPGNTLRFVLGDEPTIELTVSVLDEDPDHERRPATALLSAPKDHDLLGDYATILDDAMSGDHRHVADIATVEEAWRIIEPLSAAGEPPTYQPGSAGPFRADGTS